MASALVAGVEHPASADRLPVAVEVQADHAAVGGEHRRAGVAAGGVQVGQEVDRLRTEHGIDGAEEVALGDRLEQYVGRVERGHAGVLFDYAGHGGHRRVEHGSALMQDEYDAEGNEPGSVRDRIHRPGPAPSTAHEALIVRLAAN